jgi:tetratricopeptide (TPR) repeat protein
MPPPAGRRVFLSAASAEFRPLREKLAVLLQRSGIDVEFQEIFPQTASDTVRKLADLIRHAPLLVHIIGHDPGATANAAAVTDLLANLPRGEFLSRLPELRDDVGDGTGISYTQWEALLALHYGVPLLVYATANAVDPVTHAVADAFPQKAHYERMRRARRYPELCASESEFIGNILSAVYRHFGVAPPAVTPQNLPYPTLGALFKGRADFLSQIEAQVGPRTTAVIRTRQAIHGMGGVGKTRAAVEYAWAHADAYNALLFVTADSPEALGRNLAALAGPLILNLPEQSERETTAQTAAVLRWLNTHPGWLLIVDNVDTEDAQQAVSDLLPRVPDGHVLVTSRLADWPAGVAALDLDVLSAESSIAFLLERTNDRRSRRADDADVARTIASLVDRLALALEQCAAYVRHRRCALADYLAEFEAKRPAVLKWHDAAKSHYPLGIAVTYDASVAQLDDDAKRLLQVLSWVAPEPIPLWAVEKLDAVSDPRASLVELTDLHLARLSADGTTCSVHRLLQEITRQQQTDALPAALNTALTWISAQYPFESEDVRFWPVALPLMPHAVAVATFAAARGGADLSATLFNQVGLCLLSKADFAEAEALFRRANALNEQALGASHPRVALNLHNLSAVLRRTNRLGEAERLARRALAIAEEAFGESHPDVARILNELGHLLLAMGKFEAAESMLRRALAIDTSHLDPFDPRLAERLDTLAQVLFTTQRFEAAEPLMRRALAIVEGVYGDTHPVTGRVLNNLAQLLGATGRWIEAEPLMRRVLAIDERALGDSHPDVAISLANLAVLLRDSNRAGEAEPLLRRAIAIEERALGDSNSELAVSLGNLAKLLHETGRSQEAEQLLRRSLAILVTHLQESGYQHRNLKGILSYYLGVLVANGSSVAQATSTIEAMLADAGISGHV